MTRHVGTQRSEAQWFRYQQRSILGRQARWGVALLSGLMVILNAGSAIAQLNFPPPKDRAGRPDRRRGAGSRGGLCSADTNKVLHHLTPPPRVPEGNTGRLRFLTAPITLETTAAYPELFWYVPPTEANTQATFELVRRGEGSLKRIHRATFPLSGRGVSDGGASDRGVSGQEGLMRYRLPEGVDLSPLDPGITYQWTVSLQCGPELVTKEKIRGRIIRVVPDKASTAQFETLPLLAQVQWSVEQGYWFDALAQLRDAHCPMNEPSPTDEPSLTDEPAWEQVNRASVSSDQTSHQVQATWTELLKDADLEYFTQVPWLETCRL